MSLLTVCGGGNVLLGLVDGGLGGIGSNLLLDAVGKWLAKRVRHREVC
jgi:hypothetical protein